MSKYSLLSKREAKRNLRQAALFGLLTIFLIFAIIFWGIPALVRMAVFVGDLRGSSQPVEQDESLSLQPPTLYPLPEATNSAEIKISGISQSGLTIKVFLTGADSKDILTDDQGNFSTKEKLTLGRNEIYAVAADAKNKQSNPSDKMIVWYDNEAPSLEISQPNDGTVITEDKGKVEIIGKADSESEVLINDHLTVVDKDGNFKYTFNLSTGENKILITATDQAGNKTEKTLTVNYSP
jgi:hypothetical protein